MQKINPKFKKGELYRVAMNMHLGFSSICLVEEDSNNKFEIPMSEIVFGEEGPMFEEGMGQIDNYDEKITDPAEKAYWLLRFENERNKNE